ncbi:MAG: hypothetical protein SAJ12_24280 [Jaaginema sp. PMC 1079.18]|nr:hypothetical protein [Jaaginema sp. PMC 1080.18]MEC4854112.1 hypothetical protein [Jaaginema sp. PMC 1079.18]MEC4867021.1 hypothetical protein [Jaaginema sp. PMC 1078.18]
MINHENDPTNPNDLDFLDDDFDWDAEPTDTEPEFLDDDFDWESIDEESAKEATQRMKAELRQAQIAAALSKGCTEEEAERLISAIEQATETRKLANLRNDIPAWEKACEDWTKAQRAYIDRVDRR